MREEIGKIHKINIMVLVKVKGVGGDVFIGTDVVISSDRLILDRNPQSGFEFGYQIKYLSRSSARINSFAGAS